MIEHPYTTQPISVAAMREADRRAIEEIGIPGVVLMENAGRGAAQVALAMLEGVHRPNVVILAGRGNNGGDGYVIARHLANAGAHVHVRLLAKFDDVKGDAETNLRIIRNMKLDVREIDLAAGADSLAGELKDAHLIVDAMLGTGAKGEIREPFASAIEAVNATTVRTSTAGGILIRMLTGEPKRSKPIKEGAKRVVEALPVWDTTNGPIDLYYWFFATTALKKAGGAAWSKWSRKLRPTLEKNLHHPGTGASAGSLDPVGHWGEYGGRIMTTAFAALCLAQL